MEAFDYRDLDSTNSTNLGISHCYICVTIYGGSQNGHILVMHHQKRCWTDFHYSLYVSMVLL